jgi:hypothetical protein
MIHTFHRKLKGIFPANQRTFLRRPPQASSVHKAKQNVMSRPELTGHASLFYNAREARKYDSSSRMVGIQREITERAIELLKLPTDRPSFILDVGCGSGLSGQVCLFLKLLKCSTCGVFCALHITSSGLYRTYDVLMYTNTHVILHQLHINRC